MNAEQKRLDEQRQGLANWRLWGPYLSERQWGTVREDYSADGDAWRYFPFHAAHARAYRWGEDGLAGLCDDEQRLCLGLALWNGRDPLLKERLFGLTNNEGNHGEDVKELYHYLDATPTHSYLKALYKYPQREFPYARLVEENARRTRNDPEFELLDTGIFDDDRYFDVFVEYAKADADDVLWRVHVINRGPDAAELHVLLQAWFRNTWSWERDGKRPSLRSAGDRAVAASHEGLGEYALNFDGRPELLFCENDTNAAHVFDVPGAEGYFKDAFHEHIVAGRAEAVNPQRQGTKAAAWYRLTLPPGGEARVRARLAKSSSASFADFADLLQKRRHEADQFYAHLQRGIDDEDARRVQRQALAGLIWSKQFYHLDIPRWLSGDPGQPTPPPSRRTGRNGDWRHLNNADVVSMPDKWEYPYYCAWDLAFHAVTFALIDPEFAKQQLVLMTREWYMHPSGQMAAYEWAYGDVNPPVHAWAAYRVFQIDRKHQGGHGDLPFLERVFHKLLLNFTWWVNRKDAHGRNIFQGGFLGMDNIGVFDRNLKLPDGAVLDQSDGTSWMAMFSLNMLRIALELALHNPVYQDIATKLFEHFLEIAEAMTNMGGRDTGLGLWDEEDEFYYDWLHVPGGQARPVKVRSMVGLVPLFAVETVEPECLLRLPDFRRRLEWYLDYRPDLARLVSRWHEPGRGDRRLLSLLRGHRIKCLLKRMLDEREFLSPFGVRSLSRAHLDRPYELTIDGRTLRVGYLPNESDSGMFGGNSNWRGPVWFPVNYLLIESLQRFHHYYGDDFLVECPTGSGVQMTLLQIAGELMRRLSRLFLRDERGERPAFGANPKLQRDPHFRDNLLFYEYFDGDTGRGVGASHQTGWTALVAKLLQPRSAAAACEVARRAREVKGCVMPPRPGGETRSSIPTRPLYFAARRSLREQARGHRPDCLRRRADAGGARQDHRHVLRRHALLVHARLDARAHRHQGNVGVVLPGRAVGRAAQDRGQHVVLLHDQHHVARAPLEERPPRHPRHLVGQVLTQQVGPRVRRRDAGLLGQPPRHHPGGVLHLHAARRGVLAVEVEHQALVDRQPLALELLLLVGLPLLGLPLLGLLLVGASRPGERLVEVGLRRPQHPVQVHPSGVEALAARHLRQRADAVVGRHRHDVLALADLLVEERQQLLDQQVAAQGDVEHLLRVRPPRVADQVVRREAEAQKIWPVPAAESLRHDRLLGQPQQHLVAERRGAQGGVVVGPVLLRPVGERVGEGAALVVALALAPALVGAGVLLVVEVGTQPQPILAVPAVHELLLVELLDPGVHPVAVVVRGDELAVLVGPVAGVGTLAPGQDGRAVLQRQRHDPGVVAELALERLGERRRQQAVGRDPLGVGLLLALRGRHRRHLGVAVAAHAVDRLRLLAVVPLVADDAVRHRRAAGRDGRGRGR
ncbi:MAG: hypothetical protein U0797_26290 [Gemmataceae bacterium]